VNYGISYSFQIIGVGLILVAFPLSYTIKNPPKNYIPICKHSSLQKEAVQQQRNYAWREMLSTKQFYLLWVTYAFGASAE